MDIMQMKKTDFDKVPTKVEYKSELSLFDSLVIIPQKEKHISGYLCMDFAGVVKDEPIVRFTGGSDVLEFDGIGGYGEWDADGNVPTSLPIHDWRIDCLPCGYLRVWCKGKIKVGDTISDFCIYCKKESKR